MFDLVETDGSAFQNHRYALFVASVITDSIQILHTPSSTLGIDDYQIGLGLHSRAGKCGESKTVI